MRKPVAKWKASLVGLTVLSLGSGAITPATAAAAEPAPAVRPAPQPVLPPQAPVIALASAVGIAAIVAVLLSNNGGSQTVVSPPGDETGSRELPLGKDHLNIDEGSYYREVVLAEGDGKNDLPYAGLEGMSIEDARNMIEGDINFARTNADAGEVVLDATLVDMADSYAAQVGSGIALEGTENPRVFERENPRVWRNSARMSEASWYRGANQHATTGFLFRSNSRTAAEGLLEQLSPSNRSDLLNPAYKHIGVGVWRDPVTAEWIFDVRLSD